MDEKEVKNAIKREKPRSKHYVAIFLVIAALLSVYFLFTMVLAPGAPGIQAVTSVNSPSDAQAVQSGISTDVQDVSADLDGIGQALGV